MESSKSTTDKRVLTGLFRDRDSAERAYQSIADRGYGREDVNVVMSDDTRRRHFATTTDGRETELGTKAAEGAGIQGMRERALLVGAVFTVAPGPGRGTDVRLRIPVAAGVR